MIFDAGSGIIPLGKALLEEGVTEIDLFFSHVHYDHIIGLPYFLPAFWNKAKLRIWAGHMLDGSDARATGRRHLPAALLPDHQGLHASRRRVSQILAGRRTEPSPGVRIVTGSLNASERRSGISHRARTAPLSAI